MSQQDLEINREIRKCCARHWLDLGRLSIRSVAGSVHIHGSLDRIGGIQEALTSAIVGQFFGELRRIKNVRRIMAELVNWVCAGDTWQPVQPRQSAVARTADAKGAPVYKLDGGGAGPG